METFFKTTADLSPSVDHLCILTFEMSPKFDRCRRRQYQSNATITPSLLGEVPEGFFF
jgi:hypothetical protein